MLAHCEAALSLEITRIEQRTTSFVSSWFKGLPSASEGSEYVIIPRWFKWLPATICNFVPYDVSAGATFHKFMRLSGFYRAAGGGTAR